MSRFTESYILKANELIQSRTPFVTVTIVNLEGHVPQDLGAKAIIGRNGLLWGTVGGGRLEAAAIKSSIDLLTANENTSHKALPKIVHYNLQQDLGMVCGGKASLFFEVNSFVRWNIVVYGAGHVAQAVVPLLANLDCKIYCADTREEWLSKMPKKENVELIFNTDLASTVKSMPVDAFYIVMTQGHATDLPVVNEILKTLKPRYLGVIGSLPKARTLKANLLSLGIEEVQLTRIICPIGLPIGSNSPQEIAISIAAQLLQVRDAEHAKMSD